MTLSNWGDMGDFWRDMRTSDKKRRYDNLSKADPVGWVKHTDYHWSRVLNDNRLDYWPSRNKFQYQGKVYCGDVVGFIKNRV